MKKYWKFVRTMVTLLCDFYVSCYGYNTWFLCTPQIFWYFYIFTIERVPSKVSILIESFCYKKNIHNISKIFLFEYNSDNTHVEVFTQ